MSIPCLYRWFGALGFSVVVSAQIGGCSPEESAGQTPGAGGSGGSETGGSGGDAAGSGGDSSGAGGGSSGSGGGSSGAGGGSSGSGGDPDPTCEDAGGNADVSAPKLLATLFDSWHEAWLGSPAIADLDDDGEREILVPRGNLLLGWHLDGEVVFRGEVTGGRIWASPVVADLVPATPGLEVAVAARDEVYAWSADGALLPGFPASFRDELRSIAASDIDGDGGLELVAVVTDKLQVGDQLDIIIAFEMDGSVVKGFPPNTTGSSGCDDRCYTQGGFDQTLALGDLDGDGSSDIFAPQDNAYISLHHGSGVAFDSAPMFEHPTKVNGVRFLHDLAEAQQGWAEDEATANQAHFTNSAPAIADIDDNGTLDLVLLGSVQNAAQTDRLRGVALWAFGSDAVRLEAWTEPLHFPAYLAGLWDFEGTNVVAATNQVSVADLSAAHSGLEVVFAGFDGKIHAVSRAAEELWSYEYTSNERVLTGGVVLADLSADGVPEVVFNSYSPDEDKSHLFVVDSSGGELHKVALPKRGAMPVPAVADVDDNGELEIVVSLKDGVTDVEQVLVYTVPGSKDNCLPWPTGRGNLRRDGLVPLGD